MASGQLPSQRKPLCDAINCNDSPEYVFDFDINGRNYTTFYCDDHKKHGNGTWSWICREESCREKVCWTKKGNSFDTSYCKDHHHLF